VATTGEVTAAAVGGIITLASSSSVAAAEEGRAGGKKQAPVGGGAGGPNLGVGPNGKPLTTISQNYSEKSTLLLSSDDEFQ